MADTPVGRVTEHVRVTVTPMRTGKDGEELTTMTVGSKENEWIKTSGVLINQNVFVFLPMNITATAFTILNW